MCRFYQNVWAQCGAVPWAAFQCGKGAQRHGRPWKESHPQDQVIIIIKATV